MDRRLLFPAVVASAWAQQTSPAAVEPEKAEAEKAVRARAEQFYQLEAGGKFRQAEAFVAEDTKDYYYDNGKPDIRKFQIDKVEFTDATHATLTVMVTTKLKAPGFASQEFSVPTLSTWKMENGEWVWYYVQNAVIDTPFGKWQVTSGKDAAPAMPPGMPTASSLDGMVSIDRTSVELVAGSRKAETVTISNQLPGVVSVDIGADRPKGLVVAVDKKQLARGEKAVVSFSIDGDTKPSGSVRISVPPLYNFVVQIKTK
jgi:hypothetical protein